MRIAQVGPGMIPIPPPDYGAVEKHIWNLSRALERQGHEVEIVNEVAGPRSVDEYRWALRAARRLRRVDADVVHVHTPGVALVLSLLGPRDFVYTTHSRHWLTREGVGERIGYELEKRAVRQARAVIAVSNRSREAILDTCGPEVATKVDVVPNGVDVKQYQPRTKERSGRIVVGLGEMAPHKRWHLAAEALRGLDAELVLAGPIRDAAYASRVEDAAPGQVRLLGPVPEDDLVETLATADVQVHPSVSENLPMAVIEGMACGLPILGSDILGDLVDEGVNGHLVPVALPDEERVARLRERLEHLLADDATRQAQAEASRERAVDRFSWDAVATRVAATYVGNEHGAKGQRT